MTDKLDYEDKLAICEKCGREFPWPEEGGMPNRGEFVGVVLCSECFIAECFLSEEERHEDRRSGS